jgi:hypothetical protein
MKKIKKIPAFMSWNSINKYTRKKNISAMFHGETEDCL